MLARLRRTLSETLTAWLAHDGARLAASLSLYSLLSLAPLVILSIAIASLGFGRTAAQNAIVGQVREMMGEDGARAVQTVIEYGKEPHAGGVASVLGLLTLLFGASSVFGELQSALNRIWEVKSSPGIGLAALLKARLFSFALVLSIGFLLLVSLVFSAALAATGSYFGARVSLPAWLLRVGSEIFSFASITLLIALIFKYVPDPLVRWKDVWGGALTTALLFTIGKALLGLYLGKAAVGSYYGAAGSLIVVIVWVYYSAMIFYFGAEYTHIRARQALSGRQAEP